MPKDVATLSTKELFDLIEETLLQTNNSGNSVILRICEPHGMMERSPNFIKQAIKDSRNAMIAFMAGISIPSKLEILGMQLLFNAANLTPDMFDFGEVKGKVSKKELN